MVKLLWYQILYYFYATKYSMFNRQFGNFKLFNKIRTNNHSFYWIFQKCVKQCGLEGVVGISEYFSSRSVRAPLVYSLPPLFQWVQWCVQLVPWGFRRVSRLDRQVWRVFLHFWDVVVFVVSYQIFFLLMVPFVSPKFMRVSPYVLQYRCMFLRVFFYFFTTLERGYVSGTALEDDVSRVRGILRVPKWGRGGIPVWTRFSSVRYKTLSVRW